MLIPPPQGEGAERRRREASGGLLTAQSLTVTARIGGETLPVIRNLDFALSAGKILGLVGESGAGKSMVGRAIAQLLPAGFAVTGGRVLFAGDDLVAMPAERRRALIGREIAFVPQEPLAALNPVLTIGQQMGEHLTRLGLASSQRRTEALRLIERVHLPDPPAVLARYPHQLSGGMCQRVLIALAFASRPRLVVADEPTTALDVTIQARIVELIAELQARDGTALIFITHDVRLAAQICDDVLVLYAGRAAEYGPARQVMAAPAHPYTRSLKLAAPAMAGPRRALQALPDRMPGLRALKEITGCSFAPRCPIAVAQCGAAEPPLTQVAAGQAAACIRTEATAHIRAADVAPAPAPQAGAPLIAVENLTKAFAARRLFGREQAVTAVDGVSFALAANEFVGLVGESGSGKSTLARLVVGLEQPSAGRIAIAGQDVTDQSPAARRARIDTVQLVFQDPRSALNPRRPVATIVTQPLEARGHASAAERRERAQVLLADIGLPGETAARYPAQLSGGQRQRVNIARALCIAPKLLIADEIVSGLDVSVQAQLINLLIRLRDEHGFSMLFISHDLAVVRYLCTRVLVMLRGRIVEQGATEQIFSAPQHPYTRALIAAVPPDDPAAAWSAMAGASA
ncbi:MAG: ABC transporter ATP-binding protein [Hyphomicrobiales bacterium]|nr:ABC transporter ATP-binding protein [Hyphomicrobiales bacterium]